MKEKEAIEYLDTLEVGNYITVNIPISGNDSIPVTAMFIGKDDSGRYNFADKGLFTLSKDFIERGKVSIDKEFNGDEAFEIYSKIRLEQKKNVLKNQNKNKDAR